MHYEAERLTSGLCAGVRAHCSLERRAVRGSVSKSLGIGAVTGSKRSDPRGLVPIRCGASGVILQENALRPLGCCASPAMARLFLRAVDKTPTDFPGWAMWHFAAHSTRDSVPASNHMWGIVRFGSGMVAPKRAPFRESSGSSTSGVASLYRRQLHARRRIRIGRPYRYRRSVVGLLGRVGGHASIRGLGQE